MLVGNSKEKRKGWMGPACFPTQRLAKKAAGRLMRRCVQKEIWLCTTLPKIRMEVVCSG